MILYFQYFKTTYSVIYGTEQTLLLPGYIKSTLNVWASVQRHWVVRNQLWRVMMNVSRACSVFLWIKQIKKMGKAENRNIFCFPLRDHFVKSIPYSESAIHEFKINLVFFFVSQASRWVHTGKLFFLFLNQNICCGYSKEPSHWAVLLSTQNICLKWLVRK